MGVNIELKNSIERYPGLIEAVSRSIDGHHIADRTVISSFNHLVRTWTVDAPNDLREAQTVGVDAVITNDPATAQQVFAGD
ncbi:hypothetical protein [Cutibacterium sp.]|uniref:glycerophosphodiester phosphodiesterase n=1 Tax=Cutibacterium sp. TaxID=1912221 RepID=UPI0026DB9EC1|nr:hypothetical protein [Cutibacterium sp.]MDO4412431.1 hypothetical protein [Cutibacterium sp.]